MRWTEWGDPLNSRIMVCAHGLSRNGRDFDFLARRLADRYRVICPDYPGRGQSDWLKIPLYYNNEQYLEDTLALLKALEYSELHWIGTSMGGIIGMALASRPDNPISRMVINDVGPFIPGASLQVIAQYLSQHPRFDTLDDAYAYYREVYASFGKLQDAHYDHFVEHGVCRAANGSHHELNYDPAIIDQFVNSDLGDIEFWEVWDRISIPTLVLRGAHSGLLLPQTVEQMKHRHGDCQSVEFSDCAHAPSLMVNEQIDVINDWF